MSKLRVELEPNEWQVVLNMLAAAPYRDIAQLIGKIAPQLQVPVPPMNGTEPAQPQAPNG